MAKMTKNSNSLSEVPNSNNAQNASIGWKELKDAALWDADADMNSVTIAGVVIAHTEHAKIIPEEEVSSEECHSLENRGGDDYIIRQLTYFIMLILNIYATNYKLDL